MIIEQPVSADDATLVSNKLEDISHALRALHYLAERTDAIGEGEMLAIVVMNMVRQADRSIAACLKKLGDETAGSSFDNEFNDETAS